MAPPKKKSEPETDTKSKGKGKSDEKDRKELLRQAYGRATQQLREAHRSEFQSLMSDAAKDLGVEWTPKPTEQEKAEQQFDQLLADYPHLAERVSEPQQEAEGDE